MNTLKLKIKLKSLAAEAAMIRREENKLLRQSRSEKEHQKLHHAVTPEIFFELRVHRTFDVRRESRATGWAYAYLRGVPFAKVEAKPYDKGSVPHIQCKQRMEALVKKYAYGQLGGIEAWLAGEQVVPKAA